MVARGCSARSGFLSQARMKTHCVFAEVVESTRTANTKHIKMAEELS